MYQNLEFKLNQYTKSLLRLMYQEYKDFLGQEDDVLFFQLLDEEVVQVDSSSATHFFQTDFEMKRVICYPTHPLLKGNSEEECFSFFQSYLLFALHSFFIQPEKVSHSLSLEEKEFTQFFSKGLVELFTRNFSLKYQIKIVHQYEANFLFAKHFFQQVSKELRGYKERMIFQNNVFYMCEVYFLHTGKNLMKKYESEYVKPSEYQKLDSFCAKYFPSSETLLPFLSSLGTYAKVTQEITNSLYERYKDNALLFSTAMEELSTIFSPVPYGKREGSALEKKKKNGYLGTIFILGASILFGIFLSVLILH